MRCGFRTRIFFFYYYLEPRFTRADLHFEYMNDNIINVRERTLYKRKILCYLLKMYYKPQKMVRAAAARQQVRPTQPVCLWFCSYRSFFLLNRIVKVARLN